MENHPQITKNFQKLLQSLKKIKDAYIKENFHKLFQKH